ncbi:MAG: sigma-70 family RNA polymerase sigma factor [Terracidiphilus sp.]|jgi:RNA polymerase sigma factor (sigma-70 family)
MTDFEALYKRYCKEIFRFALYLCGNYAEAEDIASETFVLAWNAVGRIRAATAKSYLFAIARNCYLERLRRGIRQKELDERLPDPRSGPHADAESRAELDSVLAALQQFPEVDRTALLLRVQEEMSYQEIAEAMQLPLSVIKVKIHRTRLKLAQWRAATEVKR